MGEIATAINSIYRDYNTSGRPSSGSRKPPKSDIRTLGPVIEAYVADRVNTAVGWTSPILAAAQAAQVAAELAATQAANDLEGVTKTTVLFAPDGVEDTFPLGQSGVDARNVDVFIDGVYIPHDAWSIVGSDLVFGSAPSGTAGEIRIGGMTSLVEPVSIGDLDAELGGLITGLRRTVRLVDPQWGIANDGVTDDTTALQAVFDAIDVGSWIPTVVDFSGTHMRITDTITVSGRNVRLTADAAAGALVLFDGTADYVFDINMYGSVSQSLGLSNIHVINQTTPSTTIAWRVRNSIHSFLSGLFFQGAGGALEVGIGCAKTNVVNTQFEGFGGAPVVTWKNGGGNIVGCYWRKFTDYGVVGPCLLFKGPQVTSVQVSGSVIGGVGTSSSVAITGFASNSGNFSFSAPDHNFQIGETIVIRDALDSDYDGCWPILDIVGDLISVADTRDVGTVAAGGYAEKMYACVCFDNSEGPINETSWSAVLFEGVELLGTIGAIASAGRVGSASVLFDGGASSSLWGHEFAGCLFDVGQTAVHCFGTMQAYHDRTIKAVKILGGRMRCLRAGAYIRTVADFHMRGVSQFFFRDHSPTEATISAGLVIDGGPPCRGVHVSGNLLGRAEYMETEAVPNYCASIGVAIRAADGGDHQDLHIHDNHIYGIDYAIAVDGLPTATRLIASGNTLYAGSGGEEAAPEYIVTNASTVAIDLLQEKVFVTGTGTIQTINGGHVHREIWLVSLSGLSLGTSGNIAVSRTLAAGEMVRLMWSESLSRWCAS